MERLSANEIAARLRGLSKWQLKGSAIRAEFQFEDFRAAIRFVTKVADLAEELGHHPDIDIRYSRVVLELSTHDAGGLTDLDFALATRVANA